MWLTTRFRNLLTFALLVMFSFVIWIHCRDGWHRFFQHRDLLSRTNGVREICQRLGTPTATMNKLIMTNKARKFSYCYIPKCGCTFWKRVMRFLNKDYKGNEITSPFQIPRMETHLEWSKPDTFVPFKAYRNHSADYTSFMFVREPYARLWSAYVDKFFLPDFWVDQRAHILAKRPRGQAKNCISDVSFEEFLNLTLTASDPHWDPMYTQCDPCVYKPSLIGRLESFAADSRLILEKVNLTWILEGYDHSKHVEAELSSTIHYKLKDLLVFRPYIRRCISRDELAGRIWIAFQINGYIPADVRLPHLSPNVTVSEFTGMVLKQHRQRPNTPNVWRAQRRDFMLAGYRDVTTETLIRIQKKYQQDFLLFNYDPQPLDIYRNRKLDRKM